MTVRPFQLTIRPISDPPRAQSDFAAISRNSTADRLRSLPHRQLSDILMLKLILPIVLALSAGTSVVVQQVLNANLRSALNSAVWSGFVSYFIGLLCMLALAVVLREPVPLLSVMARIPWWPGAAACSVQSSLDLPSFWSRSSAQQSSSCCWSRDNCWLLSPSIALHRSDLYRARSTYLG